MTFVLIGKLLESNAKRQTTTAVRKLIGLKPRTVTLVDGNEEKSVDVETIKPGDIIAAHPGERIAVDGIVTNGSSYIDESMLTGEPVAVFKSTGSKVFTGTINHNGYIRYKAEKIGEETILSQIINMTQHAQDSKPPIQKTVDKVASVFVPVIILIAIISFISWCILDQADGFSHGLLAALTVLVIACPCALGLATPTAITVGIGLGASNGILIKNAECLESASSIKAVVMDKTGTLTEGKPKIHDEYFKNPERKGYILAELYGLEARSEHPLAEAVKASSMHGTLIWFSEDGEASAVLAVSDQVRNTAKEGIGLLKNMGIDTYILTGDRKEAAANAAFELGVKGIRAEALPSDKVEFIRSIQSSGIKTAMVGDGINDSAALAQSDLGIAMGKGSDIAIDSAGITLTGNDLRKVAGAIKLSRLTVKTLRQNLFWAFIYNVVGIPIAAGVLYPVCGFLLNPMVASAAMALSSISVVSNSLRLKFRKL